MVSSLQERTSGIGPTNRSRLQELHRRTTGVFGVDEAAHVLGMDHVAASRLLVYLARRGWLSRVRRGLYVVVPLAARRSGEWIEDPWVVADRIFSPCYIGGWSACEYWDLTEQVFRTLLVVTSRHLRHRDVKIQDMPFHLTVRGTDALFGTVPVWRGQTRVEVSDPSRTIVDLLDDPRLGGGVRTVSDVLNEYLHSENRNDRLLLAYGDRLRNRALFKRLGYLLEQSAIDVPALIQACMLRRSAGLAVLDPSVRDRGRIVRRWRLRVNVELRATGNTR